MAKTELCLIRPWPFYDNQNPLAGGVQGGLKGLPGGADAPPDPPANGFSWS